MNQYRHLSAFPENKQVLQALTEATPSAVLLDLNMPDEDGLSIIRDLKVLRGEAVTKREPAEQCA